MPRRVILPWLFSHGALVSPGETLATESFVTLLSKARKFELGLVLAAKDTLADVPQCSQPKPSSRSRFMTWSISQTITVPSSVPQATRWPSGLNCGGEGTV